MTSPDALPPPSAINIQDFDFCFLSQKSQEKENKKILVVMSASPAIPQDLSGSFRIFPDLSGSFRIFQDLSGSFRIFQDLSGSFRVLPIKNEKRKTENLSEFLILSTILPLLLFLEFFQVTWKWEPGGGSQGGGSGLTWILSIRRCIVHSASIPLPPRNVHCS